MAKTAADLLREMENQSRKSLRPFVSREQTARRQLDFKSELALALLPTLTVLAVFALVEVFSHQRLLFVSLAATAFLIYHDPQHKTNTMATVLIAQIGGRD